MKSFMLYLIPAVLASLHASYISCFISGLSSAIVSPTVTKRSTAKFTACPIRTIFRESASPLSIVDKCDRSDRCSDIVDVYCLKDIKQYMKK